MTISLCLAPLVLALVTLWRSRHRRALRWGLMSAVLTLAIGSGLAAQALMAETQVTPGLASIRWREHNSIVLLGAGTIEPRPGASSQVPFFAYSRIALAAQTYRACRARSADCKVLVSGGNPQRHGTTEAAVYAEELAALGVPPADLSLETTSNNTWQNAANAAKLVARDRSLVVISSGFQLKRALLYFGHFRSGVKGVASDRLDVELGIIPTSMNFLLTDLLLHEQIGIARYHIYNALGFNPPKSA